MEPYEIDETLRLSKAHPQTWLGLTYQMETCLLAGVLESVQPFLESISFHNLFGWHSSTAV